MAEDKEKLVKIGDDYYADYGQSKGYCFANSRGNLIRFTNFFVVSVGERREIGRDGQEEIFYILKLKNEFGTECELDVSTSQWSRLTSVIQNEAFGCYILTDKIKSAKERTQYLLTLIRDRAVLNGSFPVQYAYSCWCWGHKFPNGSRTFNHGGNPNCRSEKFLLNTNENEQTHKPILQQSLAILNCGDTSVTMPIFLHVLSAYALPIFEDACFPIRHSLMLLGKSGFKKTSFARLLCNVFSPDKEVHSVRMTDAALSELLLANYDDMTLLDDFNFEGSKAEVDAKAKIVRTAIRSISDGNIRTKCDRQGNVRKAKIRTLLLVTGETKMTGQLASSELRYLKIKMERPFDGMTLSIFQKNPNLLKYLFSDWIRFLEKNYARYVAFIHVNFPKMRLAESFEGRLTDCAVAMKLVAAIFSEYLVSNQFTWRYDKIEGFYPHFQLIIDNIIREQADDAKLSVTHIAYLEELFNLVGVGKLSIASSIDDYLLNQNNFVGYRTEQGLIMLEKDCAYSEILRAYSARNEFFPASSDEVAKSLKEAGLTVTDSSGNLKRASARIAGRPRMLALIESKCRDVLN